MPKCISRVFLRHLQRMKSIFTSEFIMSLKILIFNHIDFTYHTYIIAVKQFMSPECATSDWADGVKINVIGRLGLKKLLLFFLVLIF